MPKDFMSRNKNLLGEIYFGLESEIVRDSLDSLSHAKREPLVIGGMAIQLHAREMPPYLRRTADLDLLDGNMNFEEFVGAFYNGASAFLRERGYKTAPKKGVGNNALVLKKNPNRPDCQTFLIHLTKFNPRIYDAFFREYAQRQAENSLEVDYDRNRQIVRAASLEEVIPLKLWRSTRFGTNRRDLVGPIYHLLIEDAKKQNWGQLARSLPLLDFKRQMDLMQDKISAHGISDRELVATYKLTKDIYDLILSSKVIADLMVDFNQDRYQENVSRIFSR